MVNIIGRRKITKTEYFLLDEAIKEDFAIIENELNITEVQKIIWDLRFKKQTTFNAIADYLSLNGYGLYTSDQISKEVKRLLKQSERIIIKKGLFNFEFQKDG
jgi:hypothetical protein